MEPGAAGQATNIRLISTAPPKTNPSSFLEAFDFQNKNKPTSIKMKQMTKKLYRLIKSRIIEIDLKASLLKFHTSTKDSLTLKILYEKTSKIIINDAKNRTQKTMNLKTLFLINDKSKQQ